MSFQYTIYRFDLRFAQPVGFGRQPEIQIRKWLDIFLKRTYCFESHGHCQTCESQERCLFFRMFEYPPVASFVISVPREGIDLHHTETLSFEITLFGSFRTCLLPLIVAIEHAGEQGYRLRSQQKVKFFLETIACWQDQTWKTLLNSEQPYLSDLYLQAESHPVLPSSGSCQALEIEWITPFCLEKSHLRSFDFPFLMTRLLQRIQKLSRCFAANSPTDCHSTEMPYLDQEKLLAISREIRVESHQMQPQQIKYYSWRQKNLLFFEGVTGKMQLEGQLDELLPWLHLGTIIHAGKAVSFGFGKYRLI